MRGVLSSPSQIDSAAMSQSPLRFRVHGERLAIARLEPEAGFPAWAQGSFVTLSRTSQELSVVCAQSSVPREARAERDRIGLAIVGVIPMTTVGLLASLCTALAAANVPVFVISTYDTDWILVPVERFEAARGALHGLGHTVSGELPEN